MKNLLFLLLFIIHSTAFSQNKTDRHLHIHFKVNNAFGELTNLIVREVYEDGFSDTIYAENANHSIDIDVNKHVLLELSLIHI